MDGPPVGIVGLGTMGSAMSANLIAAGFRVVGFDVDPRRLALHEKAGGEVATSPSDVATGSTVMVLSLPSVGALDSVLSDLGARTTLRTGGVGDEHPAARGQVRRT